MARNLVEESRSGMRAFYDEERRKRQQAEEERALRGVPFREVADRDLRRRGLLPTEPSGAPVIDLTGFSRREPDALQAALEKQLTEGNGLTDLSRDPIVAAVEAQRNAPQVLLDAVAERPAGRSETGLLEAVAQESVGRPEEPLLAALGNPGGNASGRYDSYDALGEAVGGSDLGAALAAGRRRSVIDGDVAAFLEETSGRRSREVAPKMLMDDLAAEVINADMRGGWADRDLVPILEKLGGRRASQPDGDDLKMLLEQGAGEAYYGSSRALDALRRDREANSQEQVQIGRMNNAQLGASALRRDVRREMRGFLDRETAPSEVQKAALERWGNRAERGRLQRTSGGKNIMARMDAQTTAALNQSLASQQDDKRIAAARALEGDKIKGAKDIEEARQRYGFQAEGIRGDSAIRVAEQNANAAIRAAELNSNASVRAAETQAAGEAAAAQAKAAGERFKPGESFIDTRTGEMVTRSPAAYEDMNDDELTKLYNATIPKDALGDVERMQLDANLAKAKTDEEKERLWLAALPESTREQLWMREQISKVLRDRREGKHGGKKKPETASGKFEV